MVTIAMADDSLQCYVDHINSNGSNYVIEHNQFNIGSNQFNTLNLDL